MIDPTDLFQRQWEDQDPLCVEINRLRDENDSLREIVGDLIQGARRDRAIIMPRLDHLHVIETRVTKGQVMRAMAAITQGEGK